MGHCNFWFSQSIGTFTANGTEGLMFYQVKVMDSEGKLKKVISSQELSKRYWNTFFDEMSGDNAAKTASVKQARKKKKELEFYFDHYCSSN